MTNEEMMQALAKVASDVRELLYLVTTIEWSGWALVEGRHENGEAKTMVGVCPRCHYARAEGHAEGCLVGKYAALGRNPKG